MATEVMVARWVQLKPCYAHAHGCTQAFLPPVIVAFSNSSGVEWTVMRFQSEPPFSNSSGVEWTENI